MLFFYYVITAFCFVNLMKITTANSKFQTYTKSNVRDMRLEPMKPRLNGYSSSMCAYECEKTENCVSFSYHATMELCEINLYNPGDVLATTYESSGWEIFNKYEEKCWPTDGYEGFVWEGVCYFWPSEVNATFWVSGQLDCKDKGAGLVCMDSEAENEALTDHVPFSTWWMGLNDLDADGVFTCNGSEPLFTNWISEDQTWISEDQEHRQCTIIIKSSGLWSKIHCISEYPYACERQLYQ